MRSKILIFLYLIVAVVPYFEAADKVDTQMLYLNILNCLNIYLLIKTYKRNSLSELKKSISNLPVVFMGLFFLWSCITIIPAGNKIESLVSLSEILTILISLVFLIHHFSALKKLIRERLIFILILIVTSIELFSVYLPYLTDIIAYGQPSFQSMAYRGISGNINVMSYSLLLKLPFFIYYLFTKKNNRYILYSIVILITYAMVAILETRSAILSLILITLILSFFFYISQNRNKFSKVLRNIILPVLFGFFLSSIQSNYTSKTTLQDRMGTLLEAQQDTSINQRIRFYKGAVQSFLEHPIIGIGVGNWEIESVKYERKNMTSYVVPYHAHNDYLEIVAESGILAVIFYFGSIFLIMFLIFKKILNGKIKNNQDLFNIVIFCSFSAYLLDSMFNFPQARILSQMNLILLLSLSIFFIDLKFSISLKLFRFISLICFPLILLSLYSSVKVYDSSRDQMILLKQFNINDFTTPSLDAIEQMQHTYPNVTPTGLPIASHKALHFLKNDQEQRSIELFHEGLPHNPYLMMTESFLGYAYDKINEHEKGLYYTKLAFDFAPHDVIHFGNYLNSLYEFNDSIAVKNAYLRIPDEYKDPLHDELYLLVISSMEDPSSSNFILEGVDINYQAGTDRTKKGYYFAKVGVEKTYSAYENYELAQQFFDEENYSEAAKYFLIAADLNPYELVYLENAANSYMQLGKDEEALNLLNKLVNEYNAQSPKVFYFRGLLLYELDKIDEACKDLNIANEAGLFGTTGLYKRLCN